jgi:hypothetical protein
MTPYRAQRLRFGILAARHTIERDRLTEDQLDFLEGCETVAGWAIKYSRKAYERERDNAVYRLIKRL